MAFFEEIIFTMLWGGFKLESQNGPENIQV